MKRKPLQGLVTVLRFNWHFFVLALAGIFFPPLAATLHAYDLTGLHALRWLDPWMSGAGEAANIHSGFDETTTLLEERHLEIIGILLIALALLHVVFPRYFKWREELQGVSLITRQILHVHTFFIALTVFLTGALCLTSARDLTTTALGRRIALGLFIFWFCRLILQFFGYSSKLWRGRPFETFAHVMFSLFWLYLSAVFLLTFLG